MSQKKKLVTEASDADDRLFRNSRPKETFLDERHWCHWCHWRKSEVPNFYFFLAYILYIIDSILYRPDSIEKLRFFFLEFITLLLVTLVTLIKKEMK